jgi:dinuclear metal center YbgI/SA1388 family protein
MAAATAAAVDRDELVAYLDDFLDAGAGKDFCPNGLQVEGRGRIGRLVTGVSACLPLFAAARERGADAVLVHHGLFWDGAPRRLTGVQYRRVAELIRGDLNLLAYHLPLDRHPEVGNNAVAARGLGLVDTTGFGDYGGLPVGVAGRFPEPLAAAELVDRCRRLFGQEPLAFACGPDPLSTVGIISGSAEREVHDALARGLDAFITGEVTEWVMNLVREAGIHYLACGHYATERLGIQALGDHLARRFGLAVEFVDVPNPV